MQGLRVINSLKEKDYTATSCHIAEKGGKAQGWQGHFSRQITIFV